METLLKHKNTTSFEASVFTQKALAWAANAFDVCACLLNNGYTEGVIPSEFETLIAVGEASSITKQPHQNAFSAVKNYFDAQPDWLFGFWSYDLKNDIEDLSSTHPDGVGLPEMHFFRPLIVLKIDASSVHFIKIHERFNKKDVLNSIENQSITPVFNKPIDNIRARFTKEAYIETVNAIKNHIRRGDIFEMNLCQEFYAESVDIDPLSIFSRLNALSPTPFAAFYRYYDRYVLCASPERFIRKKGQRILSQPIKGTSKRGATEGDDLLFKNTLRYDPKNRSEHIMIVDLVRNDLGKSCAAGSVKVSDLCGIYSFTTVHHIISTIEGQLRPDVHFTKVIEDVFPAGSMTGAPKVRALQLIERYERTRRGVYSGAVGYITPGGDFDFNVVIRTILYNKKNRYLSFQVGGAIVADSDPEAEYEECLIKTKAIRQVLTRL